MEQLWSLVMNSKMTLALPNIEGAVFWEDIHVFLCEIFDASKALCYCYSNIPSMDMIYHLTKSAGGVILKSVNDLIYEDH